MSLSTDLDDVWSEHMDQRRIRSICPSFLCLDIVALFPAVLFFVCGKL